MPDQPYTPERRRTDRRQVITEETASVNHCDKGPMLNMIVEGQAAIFTKLDNLSLILQNVAVQQNEINHIKATQDDMKSTQDDHGTRISTIETSCVKNHLADNGPPSLGKQVVHAVVIAVAVGGTLTVLTFAAFIGFTHLQGYLDFQRTQVNGDAKTTK